MKLKENSKTTHTGIQLETTVYSKKKHEEIYTLIFFFSGLDEVLNSNSEKFSAPGRCSNS